MSRYGASGVWVGTRFVASEEAGAPKKHKDELIAANYDGVIRTTLYTGRPMNVRKTSYVVEWYRVYHLNDLRCSTMPARETTRKQEQEQLLKEGKIPHEIELQSHPERSMETRMCE
jgi:NAD(P)H-dependent flavin oxidoreductase YrpB (nitropropane dioxygenase family)